MGTSSDLTQRPKLFWDVTNTHARTQCELVFKWCLKPKQQQNKCLGASGTVVLVGRIRKEGGNIWKENTKQSCVRRIDRSW